jgi:hypothetical protein
VPEDSRFRMSLEQFERETPRVHARPVDPEDPDGEMTPGTAFAMVEQPEPPPNPNTVEGLIAGLGKIGSVSAGSSTTTGRRAHASQRALLLMIALPFVVAVIVVLLHH